MNVKLHGRPAYTIAYCQLDLNETIRVERGAMAWMSPDLAVSFGTGGGVMKGLIRKQLGGENFFLGTYTATVQDSWIAVSPPMPGDVIDIDKAPDAPTIIAETGAFLASSDSIEMSVKAARLTSFLMREGATALHLSGSGKILLSTYGAFEVIALGPRQRIVIDTGHMVAFESTVTMKPKPLGGITTAAATGEGLVAEVTGPGRVWMQTRAAGELSRWLLPHRQQNI